MGSPVKLVLVLLFCINVIYSDIPPNETVLTGAELHSLMPNKKICMDELGCFETKGDFFHIVHRPISILPQNRVTINTKCFLYTRLNPKEAEQLIASDASTFKDSDLDPAIKTKIIIHGYMDSELYGPWMQKMKDEMMLHGGYNVIIVDWSGGNRGAYSQATANSRVVGAELALILEGLKKHLGVKMEDVHLIGHSLGSHIAGYAGKRVKAIGRITGLDPAEPYFQNMPQTVRIDSSDANYVDIIHSDATNLRFIGFGMSQLVGHVDFFPNNGRTQPGCSLKRIISFITDGLTEGMRRFASCNHQRAIDFMHYTINYKKVVPVGHECSSWEDFLEGDCADCGPDMSRCAIMGMRADEYNHTGTRNHRSFYLKTSDKAPFWLYHYKVQVKLFKPRTSFKDTAGTLTVSLIGTKDTIKEKLTNKGVDLYHGTRYQYLVTTNKDLGAIKGVSFTWSASTLNPISILVKPKIHLEYVAVYPMNVIEKSPRSTVDRIFCGKAETPIKSSEVVTLQKSNACIKS